ncbi:MAG: di-heme oxidoredictase family protein [Longimicrobiales bacterium]|nr:di-heme oxidoredictase family protein [Longimicrobiales bacterium]
MPCTVLRSLRPTLRLVALPILSLSMLSACDAVTPGAPAEESVLEGPIAGLSEAQFRRHIAGDEGFARRFTVTDGLGPLFVASGCEQCHAGDGKGAPVFTLTRFGRLEASGFDPMLKDGGPQLQNRSIPGFLPEEIPAGATGVARFNPPAVTGLGLLEAVDDITLLALADPDDADNDGISGRVQLIERTELVETVVDLETAGLPSGAGRGTLVDGRRIGRFGKKAGAVNLLHQTVLAYREDMGITSDLLLEDLFHPGVGARVGDAVADPEVSTADVADVVFYIRTLRAPPRRDADAPEVVAGEALFREIGCAGCHTPSLTTGVSEVAPLDRVTFEPWTDLLLHDMGPELDDGYTEGRATTSEWRTAPLWGLGLAASLQGGEPFFLHDGRASTLEEAIESHGGEASASRQRFRDLDPADRARLIRFLESL